ncbi:hypothetical protein [Aneurinibacillus aneurinilyticus]|uniref:Uncharacterized protein n=1 Tax=Aneurinibacillus aneurinilyticus TaxID=1391 RepID=A0A848CY34_ANEAE|nr:hypothetical protein [Aneurinibacillus aneurinilyticus]NMF00039.1 hypothetical protein [Aneurinibacillus aneurinilyticus]
MMTESIANTTPINDIHAIQAKRFEERRPITLEEMRDLNVFFGNRGVFIRKEAE